MKETGSSGLQLEEEEQRKVPLALMGRQRHLFSRPVFHGFLHSSSESNTLRLSEKRVCSSVARISVKEGQMYASGSRDGLAWPCPVLSR